MLPSLLLLGVVGSSSLQARGGWLKGKHAMPYHQCGGTPALPQFKCIVAQPFLRLLSVL